MLSHPLAVVGACALAAGAHGSVFLTFADDNTPLEVHAEAPGEAESLGTLSYGDQLDAPPVFRFQVDATEEGGTISTFNAILEWNLQVGSVTNGVLDSATVTGTFVFRDADAGAQRGDGRDDDVILSGDIGQGMLVLTNNVGSVLSSSMQGLTYVPGPALQAKDPTITNLEGPFDGVYTLTDVNFSGDRTVTRGDGAYFGDFNGNAAFTGTAQTIPAPAGTVALAGFSGLLAWRTGRRPA
jgi:hypothetical protein